jgi:hypothetical protein
MMQIYRQLFMRTLPAVTILLPTILYAAAPTNYYENPLDAGIAVTNIPELLLALVDFVLLIGVPIIVMCIIYSGFLFVTGGDSEAKVQKARFVFMWTVIGALVLLGAKGIAMAIESTILSLG